MVSNEERIFKFLTTTAGFTPAAACGILQNIQNESSFRPTAQNVKSGAYGICQWCGGRKTKFLNWCEKNSRDYKDIDTQLDYLLYEITTNSSLKKYVYKPIKALGNTKDDCYQAGWRWCYYFEVCGNYKTVSITRGNLAVKNYYPKWVKEETPVETVCDNIVVSAREEAPDVPVVKIPTVEVGKKYKFVGCVRFTNSYKSGKPRVVLPSSKRVATIKKIYPTHVHPLYVKISGVGGGGYIDYASIGEEAPDVPVVKIPTVEVGKTYKFVGCVRYTNSYKSGKPRVVLPSAKGRTATIKKIYPKHVHPLYVKISGVGGGGYIDYASIGDEVL